MASGIVWIRPPTALNPAIDTYGKKIKAAVVGVALTIGQEMERYAKDNAPWTDRTANAMQTLFYAVLSEDMAVVSGSQKLTDQESVAISAAKDIVALYLSHSMTYGVFLEVCNAGKYKIIMPTMEAFYDKLVQRLRALFRD